MALFSFLLRHFTVEPDPSLDDFLFMDLAFVYIKDNFQLVLYHLLLVPAGLMLKGTDADRKLLLLES